MYHEHSRALQERFGSRALADRLVEVIVRPRFTDADKAFIEAAEFFFLATVGPDGRPDCSFKGGPPGFVRICAPDLLAFPDYDGNGMFKSLGNIAAQAEIGLLFISFGEKPRRLRVNGTATLAFDDPLLAEMPGGQALVRVMPREIFPNCPRYLPRMEIIERSVYVPAAGCAPVEPEWKSFESFRPVVPPRRA